MNKSGIQATLEKLKDSGDDILLITSDKGGANKIYTEMYSEIKEVVYNNKPSHEIVDNYGIDIEKIANKIIPIDNDENDKE